MRHNLGDPTHPPPTPPLSTNPNTQTKGSRGGRVPSVAGMAGACLQRWEGSKSDGAWGRQVETTPLSPPTNNQELLKTVGQSVEQTVGQTVTT